MIGKGNSHQLRQRPRVIFTKCRVDMVAVSLAIHMEMKNGWSGHTTDTTAIDLPPNPAVKYWVDFPWTAP